MIFKTLKDKCEYYRSLADHRLVPNGYVVMMLDGRSFSKFIKNIFTKPFDDDFIDMMNETAYYLCESIPGVHIAYTQSDEISMVLQDTSESEPFFSLRTCKLLSICASLATAKFNRLLEGWYACNNRGEAPLVQFDCKVWNVPTANDAYAWFLYRQHDCIRNSKQQTAQTYLSHKQLSGKTSDEQVQVLLERTGINWDTFPQSYKYGRVIFRKCVLLDSPHGAEIVRSKWMCEAAGNFNDAAHKEFILNNLDIVK